MGFEPYVLTLRWCWDTGFEPRILTLQWCWDAGFEHYILVLQWCWDAGFELCVFVLQWCRGTGFPSCILALYEWLWLALRLKYRPYYLMTCLVIFTQSTESLQSFQNSVVGWDGFQNTLDFPFSYKLSRLNWQSPEKPWSRYCLDLVLVSVLLNSLKPPEMIVVSV